MAGTRIINSDLDLLSQGRIKNLLDGTDPQDAATVAQLASVQAGLAWKDSARVASASNINLSSPGASIDGVAMAVNDRVLVMAQTDPRENGIYLYNGPSAPMTRAPDAATFDSLEQAVIAIEEGSSAGATLRQTQLNGVIGSDAIQWGAFGAAVPDATTAVAGKLRLATQTEVNNGTVDNAAVTPATLAAAGALVRRYSVAFGDGSATTYTVTHALGKRDVMATIRLTNSPYDEVICEVEYTTENTLAVKCNTPPATNQYTITVIG